MAGKEEQIGGRGEELDGGRGGVGGTGDVRMLTCICLNARSIVGRVRGLDGCPETGCGGDN